MSTRHPDSGLLAGRRPGAGHPHAADSPHLVDIGLAKPVSKSSLFTLWYFLNTLWLFTKDDFDTFVLPDTIFGLSSALSAHFLCDALQIRHIYSAIRRLPLVLLFNWSNLLIFDLANQRSPESIAEDVINKPWRPLPTKRITPRQTRHLILITMPLVLLLGFALDVWMETTLLFNLTWVYNDLKGGDDHWLVRNLVISIAFFLYNLASLKIASGGFAVDVLSPYAYIWTTVISAVILTTMQVQDFKDQVGDRARGRRQTAPLILGERLTRRITAAMIIFWSVTCSLIWSFWLLPVGLGSYVAYRILYFYGSEQDRRSWKLWCLWTAVLYLLPMASSMDYVSF
ncbi:MAG: hypothetical protein Q9169_003644 [Polycauliona sp. 2 TL-2023]